MPENWKLANAAITHYADASAELLLRSTNTRRIADVVEIIALRDDVAAGRRREHNISSSSSVRDNHAASGAMPAQPPDGQTPLNGIISPQREAGSLCKNNWKELQKYINEQVDRVAHIDGQLMQLL